MATNARDWTGTCTVCKQTFQYPDFECKRQPGTHSLPPKTYYHLGAGHIQDMKERRLWAPMLNLKPDIEVRDKVTGVITRQEGVIVAFGPSGVHTTVDPEEQYFLDMKPGILTGDEGLAAWEKMYLTSEQQLRKSQSTLAEIQRQIKEGNILLDEVKRTKTDNAVAVR
jgi:hypothetical protein